MMIIYYSGAFRRYGEELDQFMIQQQIPVMVAFSERPGGEDPFGSRKLLQVLGDESENKED